MKIILIGSVGSSYHTLLKLIEYEFNIVAVFGLEPKNPKTVSGYTSLKDVCKKNSISYFPFTAINDELEKISSIGPDIIFAIGISQLI